MSDRRGFSLVEVVVAVGVFVVGVVGAIALLSSTTESASATLDARVAVRLAESSSALIRRKPWPEVVSLLRENAPAAIYANKAGSRLGLVQTVPVDQAYFQIELVRIDTLSPKANDAVAGFMAFEIRVSWPVRQEQNTILPVASREKFSINTAVNR